MRTGPQKSDAIPSLTHVICLLLLLSVALILNGCAFSSYGQADVTAFTIKTPEGLVGLTKSEVIDRLGLPEGGVTDEKGAEYWQYNNANNFYLVVGGAGKQKSLVLKLENNVVTSAYLIAKGSSLSVLTAGM